MTGSTALPNEVHVSISLPYYMVQPMCRIFPGGNAYEQTIWMIYGKWCICKFHWNCIFEVWIQKQSWNVFFLKEQHTELHAMWGDRQMDVRQNWKTPPILVTWLDIKYHYYNCWSLHALRKPKYMQKREHLLITHNFIACLSVTQYKRRFFWYYINFYTLLQNSKSPFRVGHEFKKKNHFITRPFTNMGLWVSE